MIASTLLTIFATISSIEQGVADLDRGRMAGLVPGDSGRIFYQLKVGSDLKRIEVGEGELIEVEDSSSRLRIDGQIDARPSYMVEFEIPLFSDRSGRLDEADEPALRPLIARLAPGNGELQEDLVRAVREQRRWPDQGASRPEGSEDAARLRARIAELESARERWASETEQLRQEAERQNRLLLQAEAARDDLEAQLEAARAQLVAQSAQSQETLLELQADLDEARAETSALAQQLEIATAAQREPQIHPTVAHAQERTKLKSELETKVSREAAILALLEHWAQAWAEQRFDDYLAHYASEFRAPDGLSRSEWEAQRRPRILEPSFIDLQLEGPEFLVLGDQRATVQFQQLYRSDSYKVATTKKLELVNEDGHWRILEESIR